MKNPILIVGCGFLGSIFTDELLHRMFAGKLHYPLVFVDGDKWEERNASNQNVTLNQAVAGEWKVETLRNRAFEFKALALSVPSFIENDSQLDDILKSDEDSLWTGYTLIVDAVDNIKTRQMLALYGLKRNVPVLHLGLAVSGAGAVEWSSKAVDTWPLAPWNPQEQEIKDPETSGLPPCELIQMRGAGLNVSLAGAMAACIFLGFDPEEHVDPNKSFGWCTTWRADNNGYSPEPLLWAKQPEAP